MKRYISFLLSILLLNGCSSASVQNDGPPQSAEEIRKSGFGKLFGDDIFVFGARSKSDQAVSSIGVNSFLWRAALDVLSFMPLLQADPFGGVIITDWYSPPHISHERFKISVLILDPQLRSDALRVSVFRQVQEKGNWKDVETTEEMNRETEDAILLRARQLRISSLNN